MRNNLLQDPTDLFIRENNHVYSKLVRRLGQHGEVLDKVLRGIICKERRLTDPIKESISDDDLNKKEFILATPSVEMRELLNNHLRNYDISYKTAARVTDSDRWVSAPGYTGVDLFGHVDRTGEIYRGLIKEDMQSRFYLNDVLNRQVFDIEQMVYVSFQYENLDIDGYNSDSVLSFAYSGRSYVVEIDALLVRYASITSEDELDRLLDSICIMITDKVVKLIIADDIKNQLLKVYCPHLFRNKIQTAKVSPRDLFITLLINKVVCDSLNGITNSNDIQTMNKIVDLADLSLRNSGSIYNISRTSQLIQGHLSKIGGRPKYLERYMNKVVENVEQCKSNIVSDMNKFKKKFSLMVSPLALNRNINKNTLYASTESVHGLECVEALVFAFESIKDSEYSMFSIIGMESGDKLEDYRRKSRAQLLATLDAKERKAYITLESEIVRYQSDAINATDVSRKNILLHRSKNISKLINLELSRSKSNTFNDLLIMLEDRKFEIDSVLAGRDFNRERNTKLYGQIIPSGDWDY
ncbi:MAG: hypothetical protein ACRCX2_36380 [Paraclostridium sp.]